MEQGQKNVFTQLETANCRANSTIESGRSGCGENDDVMHRIQYLLNNIQSSLCHVLDDSKHSDHLQVEAQHG